MILTLENKKKRGFFFSNKIVQNLQPKVKVVVVINKCV